jgi:hypothetical protein
MRIDVGGEPTLVMAHGNFPLPSQDGGVLGELGYGERG